MRWSSRRASPSIASVCAILTLAASTARADDPADAGVPDDAGEKKTWASCVERIPPGATRPRISEVFPSRGMSGYAATLEVTVTHGKGETVLPEGFKVQGESDAARALKEAGFVFPDPDGGVGPSITLEPSESGAITKLSIPFVALPKDPGRNAMLLPPVPIAIARANGEVLTVCTRVHPILIEDPIANELDPKVKPNPPARPQREDWELMRNVAKGAAIGVIVGGIAAFFFLRWLRRPRYVPPPPPRLPWVVALEELDELRRSSLLTEKRTAEYFDRVSDCVRKYLGARYGFDGLESTTDEMRALLKRVRPPVPELKKIVAFLADCDLVKFARVIPDEDDCTDARRKGEAIVRSTMPPGLKSSDEKSGAAKGGAAKAGAAKAGAAKGGAASSDEAAAAEVQAAPPRSNDDDDDDEEDAS
jgi:hypothetical protein